MKLDEIETRISKLNAEMRELRLLKQKMITQNRAALLPKREKAKADRVKRDAEIIRRRNNGETYASIAERFTIGVSRCRSVFEKWEREKRRAEFKIDTKEVRPIEIDLRRRRHSDSTGFFGGSPTTLG